MLRLCDKRPLAEIVAEGKPQARGTDAEHICQYFARWFHVKIIALRISGPRARSDYLTSQ